MNSFYKESNPKKKIFAGLEAGEGGGGSGWVGEGGYSK